jgi:hypothetical protein
VTVLGVVLGILNLNDTYKNPPVNNLGRLLIEAFTSLKEIQISNIILFLIGTSVLFILKKRFPRAPSLALLFLLFIIVRI